MSVRDERIRERALKKKKKKEQKEKRRKRRGSGSHSDSMSRGSKSDSDSDSDSGDGHQHKHKDMVMDNGNDGKQDRKRRKEERRGDAENKYSAASVVPVVAPQIYESSQSIAEPVPFDKYSFYLMVAIVVLNFGAVAYCMCIKPTQHLDLVRAGFVDRATPKRLDSVTISDGDSDDSTENEEELYRFVDSVSPKR